MTDDATPDTHPETAAPVPAPVAPESALPVPEVPARVGRYVVEGEIAHGGMGVVYRATDPDFGRTLAVKVLLPRHQHDAAMAPLPGGGAAVWPTPAPGHPAGA